MSEKTIGQLAEEQVASLHPLPAPEGIHEEHIAAKMRHGLTRKQSIESLLAQAAHDAQLAAAEKKAAKGK
jgi:hypothetical protein